MFKHKGHGFFCRCETCKFRRKTSLWYMGILLSMLIILMWQMLFTIFITTRFNVILIFILMICILIGFIRIIF
ncbi:MAG: hypothetical protein PUB18_01565 [bacterium]|nr:hypothetical protein [bacterium]